MLQNRLTYIQTSSTLAMDERLKRGIDMNIQTIKEHVLSGEDVTREEALFLVDADLLELQQAADEIRRTFCGDSFDMCAVLSVRGGRCSENCKYCSQSSCSTAEVPQFATRDADFVREDAKSHAHMGISHYCQVASGRKMGSSDIDKVCENVRQITTHTDLAPCVSLGLLTKEDLLRLKEAGVKRIHNNLETSRRYFPSVCTSHTYDEKIEVLKAANEVGLELCSGGIFGIGETWEDRIDLALEVRKYHPTSVPINLLHPVKGTPMGDYPVLGEEELARIIAIFRFLIPKAYIRLAAGRNYLEDTGIACFRGGCNASITGDMVTVRGVSIEQDLKNIEAIGYHLGA